MATLSSLTKTLSENSTELIKLVSYQQRKIIYSCYTTRMTKSLPLVNSSIELINTLLIPVYDFKDTDINPILLKINEFITILETNIIDIDKTETYKDQIIELLKSLDVKTCKSTISNTCQRILHGRKSVTVFKDRDFKKSFIDSIIKKIKDMFKLIKNNLEMRDNAYKELENLGKINDGYTISRYETALKTIYEKSHSHVGGAKTYEEILKEINKKSIVFNELFMKLKEKHPDTYKRNNETNIAIDLNSEYEYLVENIMPGDVFYEDLNKIKSILEKQISKKSFVQKITSRKKVLLDSINEILSLVKNLITLKEEQDKLMQEEIEKSKNLIENSNRINKIMIKISKPPSNSNNSNNAIKLEKELEKELENLLKESESDTEVNFDMTNDLERELSKLMETDINTGGSRKLNKTKRKTFKSNKSKTNKKFKTNNKSKKNKKY